MIFRLRLRLQGRGCRVCRAALRLAIEKLLDA
jgi:hypothetical protein